MTRPVGPATRRILADHGLTDSDARPSLDSQSGCLHIVEPRLSVAAQDVEDASPELDKFLRRSRLRGDPVGRFARRAAERGMTPMDVAREMLIEEDLPDPLPPLFHGGTPGLAVGTTLEPSHVEARPRWLESWHLEVRDYIDPDHRSFVYATTDELLARSFALDYAKYHPGVCAGLGGFGLYRVELGAAPEVDPWRIDRHVFRESGLMGVSVRARTATIVEAFEWKIPQS